MNNSIQTEWQCLNDEGNQFFTELAIRYSSIFSNSNMNNAEDNLYRYMKEVVAFQNTKEGEEADITKEVMIEFFNFCFENLKTFNISEKNINEAFWDMYDEENNLSN